MGAGAIRLPGRGRRRTGVLSAVALSLIALGIAQIVPAFAAGPPSSDVSRDLDDYVLFALDRIQFKGGANAFIHGGNVGINHVDPNPGDNNEDVGHINICTGGSGHEADMDDVTQIVGDRIDTSDKCSFWDVYATVVNGGPEIRNSGPNPLTPPNAVPIVPDSELTSIAAFTCAAGNPASFPTGGSISPGKYGAFSTGNGETVTMAPGVYEFCSFNLNKNAHLVTSPGTFIFVTGDYQAQDNSTVGPACDVEFVVKGDGVGNDFTVKFGEDASVNGRFNAPNGHLNLGRSTQLKGNFWAKVLNSDFNVQVDQCPPDTVTTTTSTTTTTTIPSTTTTTTIPSTTTTTTIPSTTTTTTIPSTTTTTTIPSTTTTTTIPSTTTTTTIPSTTTTTIGTTTSSLGTTSTTVINTGSTDATVTTLGQATPTTSSTQRLPVTGSNGQGSLVAGFALVLAGAALLGFARRKPASA